MLVNLINFTTNPHEITNIYQLTSYNLETLKEILNSRYIDEGVHSIEIVKERRQTHTFLATPTFSTFNRPRTNGDAQIKFEDVTNFYEMKLKRSPFLPLNTNEYLNFINELVERAEGYFFIQLLLQKKKGYKWRETMIDQYESYRIGNENPSENLIFREVQNSIVSKVHTLTGSHTIRSPIEAIENKILQNNYYMELRIGVNELEPIVKSRLKRVSLFNEVKIEKVESTEKLTENIIKRKFSNEYSQQLFSESEIYSILCNKPNETKIETDENSPKQMSILPTIEQEGFSQIDESVIEQVQKAFKRVKITNKKIKIIERFSGATLHKLILEIPVESSYSDINKNMKNIQATMGNELVSIEIGDSPNTIDMFIPKKERDIIYLGNLMKNEKFIEKKNEMHLPIVIGESSSGEILFNCMTEMVHLLVAGTTGSGKSVFLHNIIFSLLINTNPDTLNLKLIDPKANEMNIYNDIPHVEVLTDMEQSLSLLEELCKEMEKRYTLLGAKGVRSIKQYNENSKNKLPYIVVIIDEYADLIMTNAETEEYTVRLAQKSRAAGIHLIIATQKPLVSVVTSLLKANLPSVIGFKMKTSQDYTTIFGKNIPHRLLGKGDGVAMIEGQMKEFERFQSPLISMNEREEGRIISNMKEMFSSKSDEEKPVDKLRKLILDTGETRVSKLRELMGIRINVVQQLIHELVEEGFLKKEGNRYEINANERVE